MAQRSPDKALEKLAELEKLAPEMTELAGLRFQLLLNMSRFDEAWKVDAEGDVGAYWGLWDKDGNLKYV